MKKLLLFVFIFMLCYSAYSQGRKVWFDVQFVQFVGLNKWSDDKAINEQMIRPSTSDFRGTFNWRFFRNLGSFADMSLSIYSAPVRNELKPEDFSMVDFNSYYVRDVFGENYDFGVGFKATVGLFYKIERNKWGILPSIGVGLQNIDIPFYSVEVKEKYTNNIYEIRYDWFKNAVVSAALGTINTRLNFTYKLSKHTSLLFGLEYVRYFSRIDFIIEKEDYYREKISTEYEHKGSYMNTLGFSVGVSFR